VTNPSGACCRKDIRSAPGLAQCFELAQLRGTADKRQVEGARIGCAQSRMGGACVVTLYRAE
jgi:hypothetical protein